MKNLKEELLEAGLTGDQARIAIHTIHEWLNEHYPVLGAMARPLVEKETREPDPHERTRT